MSRFGPASAVLLALALASPACTNWDAPIGANIAASNVLRAPADADNTGLVRWDTVGASPGETQAGGDDAAEDATTGDDAAAEVLAADGFFADTAAKDVAVVDATGDDAAPDGAADASALTDAVDPCAGANRPISCACANSQQCASGLCVNGPSGLMCSPSCESVACPAGWTCISPVLVCTLIAEDAQSLVDAAPADASDAQGLADAAPTDGSAAADAVAGDAAAGPDWQGYPDANFPDDADIYGGAINSCLSLYLYQQETCGSSSPAAACIDDVATQGSLYANYLFEPVRACEDAWCVDLCASASDDTCMSQCVGKYCPNQFLSCVSNDQHGAAGCQATFSCAMDYPGKLLTIGAKCYANGTLAAQLEVGGLIACETKPNTDSCFQAIGDCFDQGSAATNTCMQTITCTQGCGSDQKCVWTCLGKAAPGARAAIDALGDCMVTVCTPKCNGDQNCQNACVGTDCGTQFSTCTAN